MDFTLLPPERAWKPTETEIEDELKEVFDCFDELLESPEDRRTPPTPPEAKRMRLFLEGVDVIASIPSRPLFAPVREEREETRSGWNPDPLPEIPSPTEASSFFLRYPHAGVLREYGGVKEFIRNELRSLSLGQSPLSNDGVDG